jgi:hypothetical protein
LFFVRPGVVIHAGKEREVEAMKIVCGILFRQAM